MPIQSSSSNSGLAGWAYATMLERIVRGDYVIGQVISRRRIAADLGVSFLPASEAFLRLECEGLLESRPRAGTRIRIPNQQDFHGHFMVKEALEVQAAMMFAERSTSRESAELIKLASRLDARAESQSTDTLTWLDLHEKLHLRLAEFAHCDALYEAIRRQSALTSAWLGAMKATVLQETQPKHEPLMRALARRKPAAAAESMRGHLHADRECTLRILQPSFEMNKKYVRTYSRTIRRKPGEEPARHADESRTLEGPVPAHSPAA